METLFECVIVIVIDSKRLRHTSSMSFLSLPDKYLSHPLNLPTWDRYTQGPPLLVLRLSSTMQWGSGLKRRIKKGIRQCGHKSSLRDPTTSHHTTSLNSQPIDDGHQSLCQVLRRCSFAVSGDIINRCHFGSHGHQQWHQDQYPPHKSEW